MHILGFQRQQFALASAVKITATSVVGTFNLTGNTVLTVERSWKVAVNVDVEAKKVR